MRITLSTQDDDWMSMAAETDEEAAILAAMRLAVLHGGKIAVEASGCKAAVLFIEGSGDEEGIDVTG